jgi:hypothetical protein
MKRDDFLAGYEQGQADMLAKCIEAVQATFPKSPTLGQQKAIAALRALQNKT